MKTAVVSIEEAQEKETKLKTDKKYFTRSEKIVRKLDNALTELHKIRLDADELANQTEIPSVDINEKDYDRIVEIRDVVGGVVQLLHPLVHRMARKYVGKVIDPVDVTKRSSLKLK